MANLCIRFIKCYHVAFNNNKQYKVQIIIHKFNTKVSPFFINFIKQADTFTRTTYMDEQIKLPATSTPSKASSAVPCQN